MPQQDFFNFIKELNLSDEVATKLWEGNIRTAQDLASSDIDNIRNIVNDRVLLNTLLPALQKHAFPIAMAKDPYKHALHLLRRDAGTAEPQKTGTASDAIGFDPGSPSTGQTYGSSFNDTESGDLPRFFTLGENGIQDRTADYNRGMFGNVNRSVHHGTTSNVNVTGGTFVQSSIGGGPVTYNNVNSTISIESYEDTDEDRKKRRSKKLQPTPLRVQGMRFSTSELQFRDNGNFWLDNITVQPADEREYQQRLSDNTVYPVPTWNTNRALIINNVRFLNGIGPRLGADADTRNLEQVLKRLGFRVTVHSNKRKPEIEQILREFAASRDNCDAAISFVFIGSHGERVASDDLFIGVDQGRISTQNVCDYFSTRNCPDLAGKPKLFFFQCCRTNKASSSNTSSDAIVEENIPANMDFLPSTSSDTNPYIDDPIQRSTHDAHSMADMLISFATAPGTKAYRDTEDGSWFVTTLCRVLKDCSSKEDMLSMLTIVNNSVMTKNGIENGQPAVQMAEFKSTLSRKVRFYPRRTPSS